MNRKLGITEQTYHRRKRVWRDEKDFAPRFMKIQVYESRVFIRLDIDYNSETLRLFNIDY